MQVRSNTRMRILMITALEVWSLAGQGGAPSLFKTLEGFAARGHEVDVVTARIGANHHFGAPPQEPPSIPGVTFHLFDLPSVDRVPLRLPGIVLKADQKLRFATAFPWLASRKAKQLLTSRHYDLLYGYEVHGVLATRLVRRTYPGTPLVTRFQGTIMHPYLDNKAQLARRYEEVLALRTPADLYIMTDDGTQGDRVLARLNPASLERLRFWRNGLDLGSTRAPEPGEREQAREELDLGRDEFVMVTATRLARWKRIDRAVDALSILRGRGVPARLVIVGDGEERTNLEQQVDDLRLRSYVRFVGAVSQPEVQRHLWAADVFMSVNELSNVGNPLLEAMVAGACILTLDEGDTRELIRNDETGVLLQSTDPSSIAEALAKLAADPQRRQRLGAAAKEFAEANFWSWQERIDAEVDAVEALVQDRESVHA